MSPGCLWATERIPVPGGDKLFVVEFGQVLALFHDVNPEFNGGLEIGHELATVVLVISSCDTKGKNITLHK